MLKPRSTLILGIILLIFLVQIRLGFAKPIVIAKPILELPPGFVELRGPHGRTVLIGPLQVTPNGGYERVVVILGQPPFMVSTEPGVTPQEIADVYG